MLIGERGAGRAYNVASGQETTIRTVASLMASSLWLSPESVSFSGEEKPGDPRNWRADITELEKLGFSQSVSLSDGITRYCRWAVEHA